MIKLPTKIETVDDAAKFYKILSDIYLTDKPISRTVMDKIRALQATAIREFMDMIDEIAVAVNSIENDLVVPRADAVVEPRTRYCYTHRDQNGMRWRFVGSRPVSELADRVIQEVEASAVAAAQKRRFRKAKVSRGARGR